ncbi:pyridoxamine 5'-phosphate oxidase [Glaciihabitans tibetensis]|uniref:Pyridoxamine 5'-phosphate oxidase n=1 Tax=Glaciihabitans tibetensis TaxID=1266600 RepID=A0A2T0VFV7_9MICO|nr:pyridoxamine 5'-phosphate oxidase family protein [Glaciihabitans tibetensis]PRY69083.1 pyridoxamine 5'-phosphate oxidase [Glaciihabitans tibetensis]
MSDLTGAGSTGVSGVDPLALVASWLPDNADPDRPRFTLGTTDADGFPAGRTVLLSAVTPDGFLFNTDANSRKVADIAADPRVSLVFAWEGFSRQLVVQGVASKQSPELLAAAYAKRSGYLKHLAWLNTAQFARLPLGQRRKEWAEAIAAKPEGPLDVSPTWDGYIVRPTRLVFWEAAEDTASRRIEYVWTSDGWVVGALPG